MPKGTKYTGIYLSCLKIQFVAENRKRLAHSILVNDARWPVRACEFKICLLLAGPAAIGTILCLLQLF